MRRAADTLADECARARAEGGQTARAMELRMGEVELECETLKRYLRESLPPESPAAQAVALRGFPPTRELLRAHAADLVHARAAELVV